MPVAPRRMRPPDLRPELRRASFLFADRRQILRRRHFAARLGSWHGCARVRFPSAGYAFGRDRAGRQGLPAVTAPILAPHYHPLVVLLLQVIFHLHTLRGVAALGSNRDRRIRLLA